MSEKNMFLVAESCDQLFVIPMEQIEHILCVDRIYRKDDSPTSGRFVRLSDGQLIPLVDLRFVLKKEETGIKSANCVIEANVDGIKFGLLVDSALEIIWDKTISPLPTLPLGSYGNLTSGIIETQSKRLPLLDMTILVPESR